MTDTLLICGIGSGMDRSLARLKEMGMRVLVVTDRITEGVEKTPIYPWRRTPTISPVSCRRFVRGDREEYPAS